jgi:Zn-dependent peptidase ImmA (M78 family)/DNA-binding XRE family transcriptional regulator
MADPVSTAVGARIRDLREQSGMTQGELAARVAKSQAAVSLWEAGRRSPALEELFAVAGALGVEPSSLLQGAPADQRSARALFRAEASRLLRDDVVDSMEPFVEHAQRQKRVPTSLRVDARNPVRAARSLIEQTGASAPPVDVYEIARGLGVQVVGWNFDESVSGLFLDVGSKAVIGVNKDHAVVRRRFTVAHELAHYVLRHVERFHLDLTTINSLHGDPPGYEPQLERDANNFAAELLMPEPWVVSLASEEVTVLELSRRFRVSQEAMGFRLVNLHLR